MNYSQLFAVYWLIYLSVAIIHSDAISCFYCSGNVTDCERNRAYVSCGELPFCFIKIDQEADTVVQSCASAVDCKYEPLTTTKSTGNTTTDAFVSASGSGSEYTILPDGNETNSTTPAVTGTTSRRNKVMIECCQQDSCNCAGSQCFAELSGSLIYPSSKVLVVMQLLAATVVAVQMFY